VSLPPPGDVLAAFGTPAAPTPLPGGRGTAWRAGDLVLKPLDMPVEALEWQQQVLSRIDGVAAVRVAPPVRALDGRLLVDGWTAWRWVAGTHRQRRWAETLRAGRLLHAALRDEPRPDFLDRRTDPWSVADRVAWGEHVLPDADSVPHLTRLLAAMHPVSDPAQLVHGDLALNVLEEPGLPAAVIDLSPYWRPVEYASAVVVADALVWEGADERLFADVDRVPRFGQHLVRALVFRLATSYLAGSLGADEADRYTYAVDLACGLAAAGR